MKTNLIIVIITTLINSLLLLLVIFKKKKKILIEQNLSFAFSVVFLIIWSLFNYLADSSISETVSLFFTRLTFPASMFCLFSIYWFSLSFPIEIKEKPRHFYFLLIFVVVASFLSMSSYVVKTIGLEVGSGVNEVELGRLYPLILILYIGMFILIVKNYYSKIKKLTGIYKNQVMYAMAGWALFLFGALLTNLILPFFTDNALWSKFGPAFSVFMVSFTAYAIIKYKFLNILIVIQRGLVYSIIFSIIVAVYIVFVFLLNFVFQTYSNLAVYSSAFLTILLGIYGVPVLERNFIKLTDKIFFKGKYIFSEAISDVSEILNRNIRIKELSKELIIKIRSILKIKNVIIIIPNEKIIFSENGDVLKFDKNINFELLKKIKSNNPEIFTRDEVENGDCEKIFCDLFLAIEGALKLKVNEFRTETIVLVNSYHRNIAIMALGAKHSGDSLSEEDKALLLSVSYQAGVSIEKARLYKKVKEYSKNLEKKVKSRTSKIEGLQREQKQIMLEVAHRLQTPLTILKGDLSSLKNKYKEDESLSKLEVSIDKLSKFIYDILKLARLENSSSKEKMKEISLSHLVVDLGEYFKVVMAEKKIDLKIKVDENIYILGYQDKLEELVTNLVSNSVKYIGEKKGRIIEIVLKKKKGNKINLCISDNGIGIEKNDIPKLFTNFYRSENSSSGIEGTGLGLVISKKIVDVHGGKIHLESEVGLGTKIDIEFRGL